jgi:proline iminopeptidase
VRAADGIALYVRDIGAGEPILLLAGGPGNSGDYFLPLAQDLAAAWRVVLPDARGTGRSPIEPFDPDKVSLDAFIADLERIRSHLGLERWTLLGHSWGGTLALAYAGRHPSRVRSIVLVGPGGMTSEFHAWYSANVVSRLDAERRADLAFWQNPERFAKDPERAVREITRATAPAMVLDPDLARELTADAAEPSRFNVQVTLAMQPFLREYDLRDGLAGFRSPVLVLQGRQDPVGETTAYRIRDALPQTEITFIENSAHWPFLEQRDVFLDRLRTFLRLP